MEELINFLMANGCLLQEYQKGDFIFYENTTPRFFYFLTEGEIKMFSTNHDAKEFIQGILKAPSSFGEAPLIINKNYPSSAKCIKKTKVLVLPKKDFLELLHNNKQLSQYIVTTLSQRVYDKASASQILTKQNPEKKILAFLDKVKKDSKSKSKNLINYTRQQIADSTGLRVETVIRTLNKLKKTKMVEIIDHKLYY